MRGYNLLVPVIALGTFIYAGTPAEAGLIGDGTNSVQVLFHFFDGTNETIGEPETNPITPTPIGPGGAVIAPGGVDDSEIDISDTSLTIVNDDTAAFCSTGTAPCPGEFWAFEFKFSAGVDITGFSLDAATAALFDPTGTKIQLLSPNDIEVEVSGDNPNVGDILKIDLQFQPTVEPVPEPSSLLAVGVGLIGLAAFARGRQPRRD
ncbi:MAG TPA: PEP-CTERM sorting domain-containing protein [Aliidongia sp.]|nr:PEP-CTERM sorting domain-containing protein [Aliidongia sp.]